MKYRSTRYTGSHTPDSQDPGQASAGLSFTDAVLTGLAPDGGLLVPEQIPDVRAELASWQSLNYTELALEIVSRFCDDIPRDKLKTLIDASYSTFDTEQVTPLVAAGPVQILELFHGPTLAFKDVALQLLGNLFEHILEARNLHLNILGATSGDTGSAAIAGVRGKPNINIFVMYPDGRTSALQELQMTTIGDDNVHALALDGSFDDCQGIMKSVFNDLPYKEQYALGAVNSVNWARVLAQIVYYFYAALRCGAPDRAVSFSVPTGNFGDIFAGYLARRMGLPIRQLILATNRNDILARFFQTGCYQRGEVHYTVTPSMDIQVASNFERYLFYRLGESGERVARFMDYFAEHGEANVDLEKFAGQQGFDSSDGFFAHAVSEDETLSTIARYQAEHDYLLDPHTAVAVAAAEVAMTPAMTPAMTKGAEPEVPMICLATAHPAKFPDAIARATGADLASHPTLEALKDLPQHRHTMAASESAVKKYLADHSS